MATSTVWSWRGWPRRCALAAMVLVGQASCGPPAFKLDSTRVTSIAVSLVDGATSVCPYAPPQLRAVVRYRDGSQIPTPADGERTRASRLGFDQLLWTSTVGSVDATGHLRLPADPFGYVDRTIRVRAYIPDRPGIFGEVAVTPRFDCGGVADFSGAPGADGDTGRDGGDGGNGLDIEVALAYVDTASSGRLVLARVAYAGRDTTSYYLVDTRGPVREFTISTAGGAGGRGGDGEDGRDGTDGTDGKDGKDGKDGGDGQDGDDGDDGDDGHSGGDGDDGGNGGNGGHGGKGGDVLILFDPAHPELVRLLRYDTAGGLAGNAGNGGHGGRGGQGGQGGAGGRGGAGGAGASDGRDGSNGADGDDGNDGADGNPGDGGAPGPHGVITSRAVDVAALFEDEIARGVPVVRSSDPPSP